MFLEDYIELFNGVLEKCDLSKKVVLWGLNEYTEKILRYSKLSIKSIDYFVDARCEDSFFFGENIQRPDDIVWDEIDLVFVSAYYSSVVIENELRNKYNYLGEIIPIVLGDNGRFFYQYESRNEVINKAHRDVLIRNKNLCDIHRGKRCFILGNGPSTKGYDLSKLKYEIVFVVNRFHQSKYIEEVDPNYYVTADPLFFENTEIGKEERKQFSNVSKKCSNLRYLFPGGAKCVVENEGNFELEQVYYFYASRDIERLGNYYIDLQCEIPKTQSTIHACIYWAIYMGVSEIYLLGCEETQIFNALKAHLGEDTNGYAFEQDDKKIKMLSDISKSRSVEYTCLGHSIIYKNYKDIDKICIANGVKLFTCAKETLVKNLEYVDYNEVI